MGEGVVLGPSAFPERMGGSPAHEIVVQKGKAGDMEHTDKYASTLPFEPQVAASQSAGQAASAKAPEQMP